MYQESAAPTPAWRRGGAAAPSAPRFEAIRRDLCARLAVGRRATRLSSSTPRRAENDVSGLASSS